MTRRYITPPNFDPHRDAIEGPTPDPWAHVPPEKVDTWSGVPLSARGQRIAAMHSVEVPRGPHRTKFRMFFDRGDVKVATWLILAACVVALVFVLPKFLTAWGLL